MFWSIPAAVGLGALHSLEPGHGKGVISAYLVATRGRTKDAVLLGLVSAVTHTASIIALSAAANSAFKLLAPDSLTRWVGILSGLLIILLGSGILYRHLRPRVVTLGRVSGLRSSAHDHPHHDGHLHLHREHAHHEQPVTLGGIVTVGLLTGLIPCPSAMAIFLASLSADRIPLGVGLVAAFSLGSAITMSAIGILIVHAGRTVKRMEGIAFVRRLNLVSSILILVLGLAVTYHALLHV